VNHELSNPAEGEAVEPVRGRRVVAAPAAEVIGPKSVRVRIPSYELAHPARFISQVLQAHVFMTPQQQARVCINRTTGNISFTGTVTISPTVLQIPGLGTVAIGVGPDGTASPGQRSDQAVTFQELINTLSKLQLAPEQLVAAIEHLHRTGTLHAQLAYTE